MEDWLIWARGPAFRFAFAFMLLGVLRLVGLQLLTLIRLHRNAGSRQIPWRSVIADTLRWGQPVGRSPDRWWFTLLSALFHISIIVTPLLLGAHVLLWERGLGLSWATLPNGIADVLTLVAIGSATGLFLVRSLTARGRAMSRPQDLFLPVSLGATCLSGFLAMHPGMNPFPYDAAMLVHVVTGDLALVLLPFTKLSHAVLFPFSQLVSELGWHLAPDAGSAVARTLGKEEEAV